MYSAYLSQMAGPQHMNEMGRIARWDILAAMGSSEKGTGSLLLEILLALLLLTISLLLNVTLRADDRLIVYFQTVWFDFHPDKDPPWPDLGQCT